MTKPIVRPAGRLAALACWFSSRCRGSQTPTVTVTHADLMTGYLCLEYVVSPVPPELAIGPAEVGSDVGIAIDDHGITYPDCRFSYRAAADGTRVIGALMVGPGLSNHSGRLRVRFRPLAQTRGASAICCEVAVQVERDQAISVLVSSS